MRHLRRRSPAHRQLGRAAVALTCVALLGGACTGSDPTPAEGTSPGPGNNSAGRSGGFANLSLASALQPFTACDDVLAYLRKEATERVTAYGLGGGGMYPMGARGEATRGTTMAATAGPVPASGSFRAEDTTARSSLGDSSASAANGSPTFSTTNTVEAGIDEGDTVKTDGTHLYVLAQGQLHILAAVDGGAQKRGTLRLPGYPSQLLKVGNTLLVAGQPEVMTTETQPGVSDRMSSTPVGGGPAWDGPVWGGLQQALWQVDVSDPTKPVLVRQLILDGSIIGLRLTGEVARVVLQSPPQDLAFVSPNGPSSEERALEANRQVIAESEIDDWLGGYRLLDGEGKAISEGRLAECSAVARPAQFHGFSTTTVLSIDLTRGLSEPNGAAVLADGQQIYASAKHLYVAIGAWQDPMIFLGDSIVPSNQDDATTTIHRFSYDGNAADYTATGEVTGSLLNDFSMSEHDGVLRVATTAGTPWGATEESESFVTTLAATGQDLAQVGRVGGLGKGERIYAVRFIGTNGYVVTFRQTDPLYVLDLADPAQPKVTGELKINGYSAYLHPLSDGRLLGVGQDASDQGRVTGAQVSIFDVSDPAAPTRSSVYTTGSGQLNAEYDYKAFLYWQPEELVLLPATTYGENGSFFNGVIGLNTAGGLSERGRIDGSAGITGAPNCAPLTTQDPTATAGNAPGFSGPPCGFVDYGMPITRTVVIGDTIYSVSEFSVIASAITTFALQGRVDLV